MKKFVQKIQKAIYGQDYVGDFKNSGFWSAAIFVSILIIVNVAILAVTFVIPTAFSLYQSLDNGAVESAITERIPSGASVSLTDGVVSTGTGEVIVIPISDEDRIEDGESLRNYLVVDEYVTNPIEAIREYETSILVGMDTLAVRKGDSEIRVIDLSNVEDMEFTQEDALEFYRDVLPFAKAFLVIAPVLLVVFIAASSIVYYILLTLLFTFITLIIAKIKKITLKYTEAYMISLYALTLILLLNIVADLIGYNISFVVKALIFTAVVALNLTKPKEEVVQVNVGAPK